MQLLKKIANLCAKFELLKISYEIDSRILQKVIQGYFLTKLESGIWQKSQVLGIAEKETHRMIKDEKKWISIL